MSEYLRKGDTQIDETLKLDLQAPNLLRQLQDFITKHITNPDLKTEFNKIYLNITTIYSNILKLTDISVKKTHLQKFILDITKIIEFLNKSIQDIKNIHTSITQFDEEENRINGIKITENKKTLELKFELITNLNNINKQINIDINKLYNNLIIGL